MTSTPEPFAGHRGAVRAIAVFPDGRRFVTGGDDATVRVWDLRTGMLLHKHSEHEDAVLAVSVTADDRVVSCGRTATVDWAVQNRGTSPARHRVRVTAAAISPGGDAVAAIDLAGTVLQPPDGSSWPSGHRLVESIAVTRNRQVVTAGSDPLIRVADWSGEELGRLNGHAPGNAAVAASPGGTRVACATLDGVLCWNRGQKESTVRLTGCEDVVAVAVTHDGRQVVAGDFNGGVWAWEPERPTKPMQMHGRHDGAVRSFAVTPNSRLLISGAEDGSIRVWDLTTGGPADPGTKQRPQAGLASDQESDEDLLDFADDVRGLAELVLDRETRPPLAIALLGRWGSGKSSFLRQLEKNVERLAKEAGRNPARSVFATAVRQVRFDAWHYNDDHLWVGIVEHLFAALAEPVPPDADDVRAERTTLRKELHFLEELADPEAGLGRRLRARMRLWWAKLVLRRARLAWAAGIALLLAAATGLVVWLTGGAAWAWLVGSVSTVLPIIELITTTWPTARRLTAGGSPNLDSRVRDTKMQLAKLDAAQELALVIEEARAGGYEQYRGLFGRAHADLRRLSESAEKAFAEWDQADEQQRAASAGSPPLERVILHIDDLDRCSPRKVVDVLAAVHMLLALRLFVVVVAVDPRWLRRCLEQYHSELFGGRADGEDGATPLDYLDKIFQVVFGLRPMGTEAERFVEALVPTESALPAAPAPDAPRSGGASPEMSAPDRARLAEPRPQSPDPQPEKLWLQTDELEFIQRLRPLLVTPRAVKRFVNLYRLVRTTVLDEKAFIRTGEYQAVLVLLAVLVAAPEGCRALIAMLRDASREGDVVALVEELAAAEQPARVRDVWTRLLGVLSRGPAVHGNPSTYRRWAGTIARFSFETWDLTEPRTRSGED
ncbi:P-loop NTPase fold protein [Saccharopolyspora sp. NPDC003752]